MSISATRTPQSCLFSTTRLARQEKVAVSIDPKIEKIVDEIAKLNLLEASSLVSALKVHLGICGPSSYC